MNSEHPEYNRDTNPYPSFGKKYNSERAIISLTSWKARINTVSKTLYSLLTQCKNFHIVLVLSEEEFPKMMDELPENLKLFVDNELIEILWVYKNYKSFKKVLFTMDKYRDVPVISADDDLIYTRNYAKEIYDNLTKKNINITSPATKNMITFCGAACGYSPNCFGKLGIQLLNDIIIEINEDDMYYQWLSDFLNLKQEKMFKKFPFIIHNKNFALSDTYFRKRKPAPIRKKLYYRIFDEQYKLKFSN